MTVIRSSDVNYNQDFIEYRVRQEQERLASEGQPLMTPQAIAAFKLDIARKVIIQGRPDLALETKSNHQLLFEDL